MERSPTDAPSHGDTERALRSLRRMVIVLSVSVVALAAWVAVQSRAPESSVLAVERLEILEADGTPALVLANSERVPPATMDGQVILGDQEEERRGSPSIIFFDGRGDEVGGLTFGNIESESGFRAVRHFSLDGYKHDQTIVMHHYQDPGGAATGISISDRPLDRSILDAMAELGLEPGATRQQLQRAIGEIPEEERAARTRALFGVQRLFLGSGRDDEASLMLNDGEGRPRIWIGVPLEGDPFIRILNEEGDVIATLP